MYDNYDVRVALVAWLKANSTITATLTDTNEIRELDWQGEDFSFPNIRVTYSVTPTQCNITDVTAVVSYFSERKSSKQAIQSQGIIAKQLHEDDFTANSIHMSAIVVTQLPDAVQVSEGVWKADVNLTMKASGGT